MMMDYPCGKFGDCSFSRFGSVIQTDRQTDTHRHTHTHTQIKQKRMNTLVPRLSSARVISLTNNSAKTLQLLTLLLIYQ